MLTSKPSSGTGMLAVFCDLAPQWHREFREWLRDDMMPPRLKIGFPASASFDLITDVPAAAGAPEPFVTVYETASLGDLYGEPYQGLRANRDARDKAFHARFIKPARYTLAWVGPELARTPDRGFAPVAVFDRFALTDAAVQEFNIWFATQYLPRLETVPGVLRVRRYLTMEGSPSHVVVHELENVAVLANPDWTDTRVAMSQAASAATQRTSGAYTRVISATR